MSRAPITSIHTRRLSTASSPDGGQHQSPHSNKQPPPENHIVEPTGREKEMSGPSTVKLPSGTSNAPSQPSKPHQDGAFKDSPNGLALPEAADVHQPNLSDLMDTMNNVLEVLKDSTIASKGGKDVRSRFWTVYRRVAEEHDSEFLERYSSDMDIVLVFSGLFSAVSTSFIIAMESGLSPNPSDTTNALLTQLVQIGLGNLAAAGVESSAWSPSTLDVRIQTTAYASLCMSLLAAFGAVLGKQWLGYYKSSRYGRGSPEERGKRRHEKFDGIITWYFDAVVQSLPILLQLSLLLFGIALSANMWSKPHSIAWVIITTTAFGVLFYSLTVMAALVSPACPFQTPISTILCMLHVDRVLCPALLYFQKLMRLVYYRLYMLRITFRRTRWREAPAVVVRAVRSFARHCLQPLSSALHIFVPWLRSSDVHTPAQVEDSEAQPPDGNLDVLAKDQYHLHLDLPDIPASGLETSSVKWLLETSTDPEVFFAAASLVPHVEWPLDLDVSETLHQLYDIYESCVDVQSRIVPSLEEKASVCVIALSHLYCGRALQAYTGRDFLRNEISRSRSLSDIALFNQMFKGYKAQGKVLSLTARLSSKDWLDPSLDRHLHPIEFADSAPEWLSHILPYHFVAGRVDEDVEKLAIAVISRLLSPPSPPSTQIIANCTLLACVMIGVPFHKEDIVRINKSPALKQLAQFLWERFETTLWGDLDGDSIGVRRRVWNFTDVICPMLQLGLREPPSLQVMWNLDLCRKIYSRARSSEQNDMDPLAALRKVQRFRFDVFHHGTLEPHNPGWIWYYRVPLKDDSYSPEDFDFLVDYLDAVYSNDHDTACDILILMSSMRVTCSPAKQHLFIDRLIACMDSSMPHRLRHLSLRAAHRSREVLSSIDAVDGANTVLTKFSSAMMSAVCPRPGATPAHGPDSLFNDDCDLCYLRLVFALARNSIWHPHLVADHHIDCCIGMIPKYCQSPPTLQHSCYIVGILRIISEQVSVTLLGSIPEEQCWDIIRRAWTKMYFFFGVNGRDADELLPVLVGGTKKYMQIASKSDLEQLIKDVDRVFGKAERRRLECVNDVKELVTAARHRLQEFSQ